MPTVADVKTFLAAHAIAVREFDRPTPTAETAALAIGCTPAEIAKTILFLVNGRPVVVVTSGDMKVKSSLLKQVTGLSGKVKLPEAEDVLRHTGYSPGGVCPFLLPAQLPLLLDSSLRRFSIVYPAAGNAYSGVPLSFQQLQKITGGREAGLCVPLESPE